MESLLREFSVVQPIGMCGGPLENQVMCQPRATQRQVQQTLKKFTIQCVEQTCKPIIAVQCKKDFNWSFGVSFIYYYYFFTKCRKGFLKHLQDVNAWFILTHVNRVWVRIHVGNTRFCTFVARFHKAFGILLSIHNSQQEDYRRQYFLNYFSREACFLELGS